MEKKKRNVLALGILSTVSILVFIWGFYYLLGNPVLKGGMDVFVALENGAGLKRGDRVQLQGVEVGSVKAVKLAPAGGVVATLRLNDHFPLSADTRARVSGDVFGAHAVEIVPGTALVHLEKGDTIHGMKTPALSDMAGELSARLTALTGRADSLFSPQAVRDLQVTASVMPSSAMELRSAMVELRRAAETLRRTMEEVEGAKSGDALRSTLARVEGSANAMVATANAMTATANAMERSVTSLHSVFQKVDQGNGTLGRLVNDSSLYLDLQGAAREIRVLAADFRANPKKFINLRVF